MGQIIELPDSVKLKKEIRRLKSLLEDLVLERDELRFVTCENIKMKYMLEIGGLEHRVYQAHCEYLRLRRKKEIIQAKKNRQETINMDVIEKLLDEEFLTYQKKLDEKIHEMNQALERSKLESLTEEEEQEFKKLYRIIVKTLHPDLNPNLSEAKKELFINATDAYRRGDLADLQIIFQLVGADMNLENTPSSLILLHKEKQRLQSLLDQVKEEIKKIKTSPPYTWKIYFEDEERKAERIDELEKELGAFQKAIRTQKEWIHELMRK